MCLVPEAAGNRPRGSCRTRSESARSQIDESTRPRLARGRAADHGRSAARPSPTTATAADPGLIAQSLGC
eukprot:6668678-Prymnesium_polylepis.1